MKPEFLERLEGMTLIGAAYTCEAEGHEFMIVRLQEAPAVTDLPNTVVLWEGPEGMVRMATASEISGVGSYYGTT
jgi:hypothetical protein